MSSELAIRVDGVGKAFAVYDKPYHRLLQQLFPGADRSWHRRYTALMASPELDVGYRLVVAELS